MSLIKADRLSFSLQIVSADDQIKAFVIAKGQVTTELAKLQALDDGNKNLFDPINVRTNKYQQEYTALDGLTRTTFAETNIQDSATMKLGNYFYPNDVNVVVPSLSGTHNVWTKPKPFALTYAIGKNYTEQQPVVQKEGDLITACQALITTSLAMQAIETASGLTLQATGSCSNPVHLTQSSCVLGGGVWTPGPNILIPSTVAIQLKTDLVAAVNALKTFLQTEVGYIVTDDKDAVIQGQNDTAISNINTVAIAALNTWLAYVDFNSTGVNAGNYNSFNAATLAPTKLSVVQINALKTALNNRSSFITTRLGQLATTVGTISQSLTDGSVTSSGIYGKRYAFLILRLDLLNGSLSKLISLKNAITAQDAIIASIKSNKATYMTVIPTSALAAPGNDTNMVQLVDASFLSPGDTVYVMAESQEELQRAIKSINGNVVTLNDIVPAKYKTTDKLRLYKDIT